MRCEKREKSEEEDQPAEHVTRVESLDSSDQSDSDVSLEDQNQIHADDPAMPYNSSRGVDKDEFQSLRDSDDPKERIVHDAAIEIDTSSDDEIDEIQSPHSGTS